MSCALVSINAMGMLAEYAMPGWVPATTAGPNRVELNTG